MILALVFPQDRANVSASMKSDSSALESPCVVAGVEPFLAELQQPVRLHVLDAGHPSRPMPERFVRQVYHRHYGADIQSFYPTLLAFTSHAELRAVVGVRACREAPLFSEQYLDTPVDRLIAGHWEEPVGRDRIVEVGNLALANPGQARWVIAAVTLYLRSAGYRWVLFTAVTPLVNAFHRLGLNPIRLAPADPERLEDRGRHWGRYYDSRPHVCAGDIEAGYRKLCGSGAARHPRLAALFEQAERQAAGLPPSPDDRLGCAQ